MELFELSPIDIFFYDYILPELILEEEEYFRELVESWEADNYLSTMEAHEIWF